jgi:hypothetical protein
MSNTSTTIDYSPPIARSPLTWKKITARILAPIAASIIVILLWGQFSLLNLGPQILNFYISLMATFATLGAQCGGATFVESADTHIVITTATITFDLSVTYLMFKLISTLPLLLATSMAASWLAAEKGNLGRFAQLAIPLCAAALIIFALPATSAFIQALTFTLATDRTNNSFLLNLAGDSAPIFISALIALSWQLPLWIFPEEKNPGAPIITPAPSRPAHLWAAAAATLTLLAASALTLMTVVLAPSSQFQSVEL